MPSIVCPFLTVMGMFSQPSLALEGEKVPSRVDDAQKAVLLPMGIV